MTTRDPKPTGQVVLKDYYHESPSGHFEKTHQIMLTPHADGQSVVLVDLSEESNSFKIGQEKTVSEQWVIPISQLLEFIKANGRRV